MVPNRHQGKFSGLDWEKKKFVITGLLLCGFRGSGSYLFLQLWDTLSSDTNTESSHKLVIPKGCLIKAGKKLLSSHKDKILLKMSL